VGLVDDEHLSLGAAVRARRDRLARQFGASLEELEHGSGEVVIALEAVGEPRGDEA